MSPASQTLRRRTTRPRRPRPVHSRNHQERPQEYKDRGAGGRRPLGRVGIMVVGAERRPRRLGDARREARLESCYRDPAMHSRWDDAEARRLEGLDLLVYASRLIGAETSLVVWGGGNTSIKTVERDHRRRDVPVLRVKGSGSDLKSVQRKDFPGVRMDDILALLERDDMGDQEMVSYLAHGLVDAGGTRPSIETLLHGFLSAHAVIHTHADAIVSLTNNDRHRAVVAQVYGKDVIALPYRRPGFRISRDVADALRQHPDAKAVVLERHGTITWGAALREAYDATIALITRAEEAIAEKRADGGPSAARASRCASRRRGAWPRSRRRRACAACSVAPAG